MYANGRCDVCERQVAKTAGAMYANIRSHNEDSEVDGEVDGNVQTAVFINHTVTMTSIEPTHVPVHDRIRTTINSVQFIMVA